MMSFKRKIQDNIINRSNSYHFYKDAYEKQNAEIKKLKDTVKKQQDEINKLNKIIGGNENYINLSDENEYLKSLLDFEIKNVKKYLYELVELNKEISELNKKRK